ncbi:F-box/FBD/LRR-repeat protein At1g13570-like [Bidens hawaiensis]|uniref:F-box/FBD/LRR-repeat protein At1g13570-like n=1 Tax=Bidens hawaiensis TaxID=980011 RepID=UPI0040494B3B
MEVQGLYLDRISTFPLNIIQTILSLMPMRDAFRTSILSRNWRDYCLNLPKLVFDDAVFQVPTCNTLSIRFKLLYIVYPILLLHQGPILEFSLCMSQLNRSCEIDQIILRLSRNPTVKKLTLCIGSGYDHKLLPAFFKLQQLTVLKLQKFAFQPPVTFKGFSRLVSLSFKNVSITAKDFLWFISSCPQLNDLTLIGDENHLLGHWNSDFVELFECLPLAENLCMNWYPIKCFATGVMPHKLPSSLIHIKYLHLTGLSFARDIYLHSALLLITSSPNIESIILEMQYYQNEAVSQGAMNLVDHQAYSCVILDHLRVIKITNFTYTKTGMDFVKLILAKSPMLEKVNIVIDRRVDVNGEVKMLKGLVHYSRASARAKITFERP